MLTGATACRLIRVVRAYGALRGFHLTTLASDSLLLRKFTTAPFNIMMVPDRVDIDAAKASIWNLNFNLGYHCKERSPDDPTCTSQHDVSGCKNELEDVVNFLNLSGENVTSLRLKKSA